MKKGQRTGHTHARLDSAEHFTIKPKAHEPRPRLPNDAAKRLQILPDDPVWNVPERAWKFQVVKMGQLIPGAFRIDRCWFCAKTVDLDTIFLYSRALSMPAHQSCHGPVES